MVHENMKNFMEGFRYDAHPMGMLVGTIGEMSTFYPDAKAIRDLESRRLQTRRLIGKMPTWRPGLSSDPRASLRLPRQ